MRQFLSPTIPKILFYFVLFFLMPTYYYVCIDSVCTVKVSFFVILSLLYGVKFGTLTLFGVLLLIILSYLMSCFIVRSFAPFFVSGRGPN